MHNYYGGEGDGRVVPDGGYTLANRFRETCSLEL